MLFTQRSMLSRNIKAPKLESDLHERELTSCLSKKIVCARRLERACYRTLNSVKRFIKSLKKVMGLGQIGVCPPVDVIRPVRLSNSDYPSEARNRFAIEACVD